ncbi:hypothetical protein [Mesorhizobium sp. CN2-181]|uniref:hypothetical protein n=1 Tax=Mesorhizobium yinganensis TaxID=3157707 RepID=UPI0032B76F22
MNGKETAAIMNKAGWTPAAFADSLNSTIKNERLATAERARLARVAGRTPQPQPHPEPITLAQATEFLDRGTGISGDTADTLERWAERRRGITNNSGPCFMPPAASLKLSTVMPPVIIGDDIEMTADGPDIKFSDVTDHKARNRYLTGTVAR